MIKIQDVIVPTKGVGKYFQIKLINLDIPGVVATFYWNVMAKVSSEEDIPGAVLLEGNLHMPQDIYDQWGTDDSYVIDWALNELNFTKI